MAITVRELAPPEWPAFSPRVADLERGVSYPLGDDRFEIDHGADYFAFFARLGACSFFVAIDGAGTEDEEIVAVAAAVLRRVPRAPGAKAEKTWYLCDLKVRPGRRGERIPWKMLLHGFPRKYPRCRRGYGISMNPGDGSENRVVRMAQRYRLVPIGLATVIHLYSLDAEAMRTLAPALEDARGPLGYLSLGGVKDIVLASTGEPMPLLHVQFGPCAEPALPEPQDDHVHMFCVPEGDPLERRLASAGHAPSATASVIHHRMKSWDWRFILTSDI